MPRRTEHLLHGYSVLPQEDCCEETQHAEMQLELQHSVRLEGSIMLGTFQQQRCAPSCNGPRRLRFLYVVITEAVHFPLIHLHRQAAGFSPTGLPSNDYLTKGHTTGQLSDKKH